MAKDNSKKKAGGLTPKRERFCQEYMIDLNATRAYKDVYKCSDKVANASGPRLLGNVSIQARITELRKGLEIKTGVSAERVINELAKVAFANIKSVLGEKNEIKDISQLPDEIAAAVESVQSDIRHDSGDSEGYTEKVRVKLYSKLNALNDLGKHLGIFKKDNEQKPIPPVIVVFGAKLKDDPEQEGASG